MVATTMSLLKIPGKLKLELLSANLGTPAASIGKHKTRKFTGTLLLWVKGSVHPEALNTNA